MQAGTQARRTTELRPGPVASLDELERIVSSAFHGRGAVLVLSLGQDARTAPRVEAYELATIVRRPPFTDGDSLRVVLRGQATAYGLSTPIQIPFNFHAHDLPSIENDPNHGLLLRRPGDISHLILSQQPNR